MGLGGTGRHRRFAIGLPVALLLGLATTPIPAAPTLLTARGTIEGEGFVSHHPTSGLMSCGLTLRFEGRMPDGRRNRLALFGRMTRSQLCSEPFTLELFATSPTGYFEWTCQGTGLSDPLGCTTHQTGGVFDLYIDATQTLVFSDEFRDEHVYKGRYEAPLP